MGIRREDPIRLQREPASEESFVDRCHSQQLPVSLNRRSSAVCITPGDLVIPETP